MIPISGRKVEKPKEGMDICPVCGEVRVNVLEYYWTYRPGRRGCPGMQRHKRWYKSCSCVQETTEDKS